MITPRYLVERRTGMKTSAWSGTSIFSTAPDWCWCTSRCLSAVLKDPRSSMMATDLPGFSCMSINFKVENKIPRVLWKVSNSAREVNEAPIWKSSAYSVRCVWIQCNETWAINSWRKRMVKNVHNPGAALQPWRTPRPTEIGWSSEPCWTK